MDMKVEIDKQTISLCNDILICNKKDEIHINFIRGIASFCCKMKMLQLGKTDN